MPRGAAKVWRAILACRTAALGGHLEACDRCGASRHVYHSCRNRHCPRCQSRAKQAWVAARRAEVLPVPYFHLVFTLPHDLNALIGTTPRPL
ncbi:MAG: transposase zinc-binding domain-containing protein [Sterolibacteriaceae bacterium]|nr:transposase zinc-binding domain-containing protein [Sterolibacteriaceae bacterium]